MVLEDFVILKILQYVYVLEFVNFNGICQNPRDV